MKPLAAVLVLLVFAGCSTDSRTPAPIRGPFSDSTPFPEFSIANSETAGFKPAKAIIRALHGEVQYANGGGWEALRVNLQLTNGAQIRTGHGANALLQVNGLTAIIKLLEDSQLDLIEMMGKNITPTRTALEVRKGTIHGFVEERPRDYSFQVRGGGVTLKAHGGEFQMSAEGRVEIIRGAGTITAGGKAYQLTTSQYFDLEKNEAGNLPPPANLVLLNALGSHRLPKSLPGPPALSPFDRGLENARRGWVDPAAGN